MMRAVAAALAAQGHRELKLAVDVAEVVVVVVVVQAVTAVVAVASYWAVADEA